MTGFGVMAVMVSDATRRAISFIAFSHQVLSNFFTTKDELYGELGNDHLYGGDGDDILIGDMGHALRRYSENNVPIYKTQYSTGHYVWHNDIVLEEHGNITAVTRISQKLDTSVINAESIAAASLLFIAVAYDDREMKVSTSGNWLTDMFTYSLEEAFDDFLFGDAGNDILIGQRGNDYLSTGKWINSFLS